MLPTSNGELKSRIRVDLSTRNSKRAEAVNMDHMDRDRQGVTGNRLKATNTSGPTYHIKKLHFLNTLIFNSLNYVKNKKNEIYCSDYQHRQSSSSFYLKNSVSETVFCLLKAKTIQIGRNLLRSLSYPRDYPHFMEPKCSLLFPQESVTGTCPQPNQSSPCLPTIFL